MVRPRNSAHGAAHREGFSGKFHHRRDTLVGKLSLAGEETPSHGVEDNRDGEQQVKQVHWYVMVNPQEAEPL